MPRFSEPVGVVYLITNIVNGKMYVGQTNNAEKRFKEHMYARENCTSLARAVRKYGAESFRCDILAECFSRDEMNETERMFIESIGTMAPDGYNLRTGGDVGSKRARESVLKNTESTKAWWDSHPEEKARMSEVKRAQWRDDGYRNAHSGDNHHMSGVNRPEYVIDAMRSGIRRWWLENREEGLERLEAMRESARLKRMKRVRCVDTGIVYGSIEDAGRECGIKATNHITSVCRGRRKTCGGFRWEYVDD